MITDWAQVPEPRQWELRSRRGPPMGLAQRDSQKENIPQTVVSMACGVFLPPRAWAWLLSLVEKFRGGHRRGA